MRVSWFFLRAIYCSFFLFTSALLFGQQSPNFIDVKKPFFAASQFLEDAHGFMVATSNDGLFKYDGYDFHFLPYEDLFGADFSKDRNFKIFKDAEGHLWISSLKGELSRMHKTRGVTSFKGQLTIQGHSPQIGAWKSHGESLWLGADNGALYSYSYESEKITRVNVLPNVTTGSQQILSIVIHTDDELWISTLAGVLYSYSISKNEFAVLQNPQFPLGQKVRLINDLEGRIWMTSEKKGLFVYDPSHQSVQSIKANTSRIGKEDRLMFISLFCDQKGRIWAGTDGDGLHRIDTKTKEVKVYQQEESNPFSIGSNTIVHVTEDSKGNIWCTLKNGLVNVLPKENVHIQYYNGLKNNAPTKVNAVFKATDTTLWIGTDGEGLLKVGADGKKIAFSAAEKGKRYFKGRYIQQLQEDVSGNVWIGTYQHGLWIYDAKTEKILKKEAKGFQGDLNSDIRVLFKDSANRMWVSSTKELSVFSQKGQLLRSFTFMEEGLFGNFSMSITQDENGVIWMGVNPKGLYSLQGDTYDLRESYFKKYTYFTASSDDVSNYNIHTLKPDQSGNLWILCASGVLIKYDIKNQTYKSFAKHKDLRGISLYALLLDNPNELWLSSSNGLHHYKVATDQLKSYYQTDGFKSNNFSRRSAFKGGDGTMYFGGKFGVNAFQPKKLTKNLSKARLLITAIDILNKPAISLISDQVNRGVENVQKLQLASDQSSFSFQFSAVDNVLNSNYHYAYRLKGFDQEWIVSKKNRIASYTNIPFGNYTFEVKAGTKYGEWDIPSKSIALAISPPWWFSNFAIFGYCMLFVALIFWLFIWLRLKNRLSKEVWQNNKEKELYALKMNFFAKMSHEIQTPLTLILGPIEDMLERAGVNGNYLLKQRLLMISNNANRLSRIAKELMTLRNRELGKLRIFASKNDLVKDLKRIAVSFGEQARFKNIDFIQEYSDASVPVWYDLDKLEHVIYNLLSNAFKFTPKEGAVSLKVTLQEDTEFVVVSVTDSGPGIPQEELDDIFKLFYQSDLGKSSKGLGVGLALTKELITLHQGKINVASSPEKGTCFSFQLRLGDDVFSEAQKIAVDAEEGYVFNSLEKDLKSLEKELSTGTSVSSEKKHAILLVEDNIEMQMFLKDVLGDVYDLFIAENGKEGIDLAKKHLPDLILSDIMMPVMDGIAMCKQLQERKATAHIPVILLTAKNTSNTKLKGLKSGAVEYVRKPFDFQELSLKIQNIIAKQDQVLQRYQRELKSAPKDIVSPSKDDVFMERLMHELNAQIENSDFRLEELSSSLNMSYSVIYRKCQEITGKTLIEFIRSLRLKRAAVLLAKHGYNVSEASFMVGYKDAKYFTKCFKEEFGMPPAKFKNQVKSESDGALLRKFNLHV